MTNDTFEEILQDADIRYVIMQPRNIPRRDREDIAAILYREIMLGEDYEIKDTARFIEKYGVFYLVFMALKSSEEWERLKSLASSGEISSVIVLRIVLASVFDLMDGLAPVEAIPETRSTGQMGRLLEQFRDMLDNTLRLWNRRVTEDRRPVEAADPADARFFEEIESFPDEEGSSRFLSFLSGQTLLGGITREVSQIRDHLSSLEMLSLLFPGRGWDHGLLDIHQAHFPNLHRYARIVEHNEDIRKMLDIIGRLEKDPGERRPSARGRSGAELYSVTTSGDLEHMLPAESIKLLDATMRSLFFAQWMEGKLLTYMLRGKGWAGDATTKKGPMVAMVDTSGSMHGDPEAIAKSIVLAMARRMLQESRDVEIFLFSSVGQTRAIELTNTKKMASEFLEFLGYTFEGGTDFNTALRRGVEALRKAKYTNADIVFITDGLSEVDDERVIAGLDAMKRDSGTQLFSIIVGNNEAGGIDDLSDHVFILDRDVRPGRADDPASAFRLVSSR